MRNTKIIQSPEERKSEILKQYFKSINNFPILSSEEEKELYIRAISGDEDAREKLIQCNLKLVISIAKQYQGYGIPLIDLIEEGNNGLVLSIEHYDISRKTKFSTCASWWIKYAIKKALTNNSRTVKIPLSQYNRYKRINKYINPIKQKNLETPTVEDIADELEIKKEQIELALSSPCAAIPILTESANSDTKGILLNNNDDSTEKVIERNSLRDCINNILSKLNKREELVIRKIFGIGCEEMTLREIADEFGLSYERIRQIKKTALVKIKQRYPNLNKELYND